MSDLLQIFTGNPLSTFIGKKIEAATRPELESEDWALNMEICDIINENDDDAKDAARAIKKRLQQIEQDRNFTITNRTLTVLETCVNNCSHRFHILVMTKDFIQDLIKLIGPKNNPPIELQERVLSLIENWAEAFRGQPDLNGVVSVCNDLKAKGVTFPPRDPNSRVPIQTPQRTVPTSMPPSDQMSRADRQAQSMSAGGQLAMPAPPPARQVMLEGEGYNKISQDLVVVQSSIEMFDDIMQALESPASEDADWRLADELNVTCHQMKDRIVDLIERIDNEDLTIELIRLNDELITTFTKYKSLCKKRQRETIVTRASDATNRDQPINTPTQTGVSQQATAVSAPSGDSTSPRPKLAGVSSSTLNELSLIDFNASRTSDPGKPSGASSTPGKQPAASVDPFDTSSVPVASKSQPQSLADELKDLTIGSSSSGGARRVNESVTKKATGLPEEISSVREQDFAEIENWLSTDSGRDLASIGGDMPSMEPISVPNSEFDNFIASRALAGSSAPGQQRQPQQQQQQQQPKPELSQPKPEPSV